MPKRVLVVEDNPLSLELLTELLEGEGHQVIAAITGAEALVIARAERPDLVLMDIQLPGIDGLTVTRALRAGPETREIPIVGISAYALPDDTERALRAGCIDYLPKPLDMGRFLDLVATLLSEDHPSQRRTAEAR